MELLWLLLMGLVILNLSQRFTIEIYVMCDNYFKNKKVIIIGASGNLGDKPTHKLFPAGAHLFLFGSQYE